MFKRIKNKLLRILLSVLSILIIVIFCVLLGFRAYFRLSVADYYKNSEKAFVIPGLGDGFIPQGLTNEEGGDVFYITGYMNDGSSSPVYALQNGEIIACASLRDKNGDAFTSHAGGLSVWGDYVYVANGNSLAVFLKSDILSAQNYGEVYEIGEFSTVNGDFSLGIAFTAINDGRLYIGEFYREQNYPTADSHKISVANGEINPALCAVYELTDDKESFCISSEPCAMLSIPGLVQGMAFKDGNVYLSTSYGMAFSYIYEYSLEAAAGDRTFEYKSGSSVPLTVLDEASLINEYKIAPMSEEIVFSDGKLYTMCESASQKYIFGNFTSAYYCYATELK